MLTCIQGLRASVHAALEAERAQDRTLNQQQSLERPAQVHRSALQAGGTTTLVLNRPVRLTRGSEVVVRGSAGARSAKVRASDGDRVEIEGAHADATEIMGRPLHLSERLGSAVDDALARGSRLALAAAGLAAPTLGRRPAPTESAIEGLEDDQRDALERSLGSELLLVLGPPGTGKTQTVARTISALLLMGERVLLLAPTHAAVDTALARVAATAGEWGIPAAALLRQGRHGDAWKGATLIGSHRSGFGPAVTALEERGKHLGRDARDWTWGLAGALGVEWTLTTRLKRLEARAQAVLREDGDRLDAISLLRETRALCATIEAAAAPARLVGATLAEAMTRPPAGSWDAVVIDEAAMAHVPYALWAASLARRRVLLWGDPHQLGPVCSVREPSARAMLARSLFHHLGCDRAGVEDARRPVLRVQHRMAPRIRQLVAEAFYDGVLRDGPSVRGVAGSVEVLDSAGLALARSVGSSRANETHANMAAARAHRLRSLGITSVAVITPYRAQVECLRNAIRARVPDLEEAGGIVGTVHTAQGSEHDAVIVDLVATRDNPGGFLNERTNPDAASLLCVALSRARRSLTIVADTAALPRNGVASRVVAAAARAAAAA
jgi:hypothetical protein